MLVETGKRRNKVKFVQFVESRGTNGEVLLTPQDYLTNRRARISTGTSRELEIAKRVESTTTHVVSLRWEPNLAAVSTKMQIVWGDRTLNIIGIDQDNDHRREITFLCKEPNQGT